MNESPRQDIDLRQLLTIDQGAETLQVSTKQVRRLIARGEISAYRFGRLIRISPAGLQDYIAKNHLAIS